MKFPFHVTSSLKTLVDKCAYCKKAMTFFSGKRVPMKVVKRHDRIFELII